MTAKTTDNFTGLAVFAAPAATKTQENKGAYEPQRTQMAANYFSIISGR
jgi:hypothetical protein